MLPAQTAQAFHDLGGKWLYPVHNGTFDLAMHAWQEPLDRIVALADSAGVALVTPCMGERVDLQAPANRVRWWRQDAAAAASDGMVVTR